MPDSYSLKSERFDLRPLTEHHLAALTGELCTDPQVVKTLLGDVSTPQGAEAQARLWIDPPATWQVHGCGSWGVFDRSGELVPSEALIGVVAASEPPPDVGLGPEIYYFFAPRVWGRGVGRETVTAMCDYLVQELAAPALEALIFAEINPGSVRLAEGLGMTLVGRIPIVGRHLSAERALETIRFDLWRIRQATAVTKGATLSDAAFRIGQFLGEGVGNRQAIEAELLSAAAEFANEENDRELREGLLDRLQAGMKALGMAHYRVLAGPYRDIRAERD